MNNGSVAAQIGADESRQQSQIVRDAFFAEFFERGITLKEVFTPQKIRCDIARPVTYQDVPQAGLELRAEKFGTFQERIAHREVGPEILTPDQIYKSFLPIIEHPTPEGIEKLNERQRALRDKLRQELKEIAQSTSVVNATGIHIAH